MLEKLVTEDPEVKAEKDYCMEMFGNYVRIFTIIIATQIILPVDTGCGFVLVCTAIITATISAMIIAV
jgi:hypothetical protein